MSKFENPYFRYSLLLREIDNLRSAEDVSTIALILIKLDGLNRINERFGYLGGDKILEETAIRLAGVAREQDQTFEISGKSFALLISNPLSESHVILAAQKIAKAAEVPVQIGAHRARVRAKMGISMLRDTRVHAEQLLRQCEIALSDARDRDESYIEYSPDNVKAPDPSLIPDFDISKALDRGQMEVHYQPKIFLSNGKLAGAEALIRWRSPTIGIVSPSQFLPSIEKTRDMHDLLWFVLNSALRCAAEWARRVPGFSIAINLSPENFEEPDLADIVADALEIWNYPAEQLLLEVTETTMMSHAAEIVATMQELKRIGLRMAIDDFGTGYSSLAYLKDLPADQLKIDRYFIESMGRNATDQRIVRSIIDLSDAVGLEVVAEGVDSEETLRSLIGMGCQFGQGFHIAEALPVREFESEWIENFAEATTA